MGQIKILLFVLTSTLAAFSGVILDAQTGTGYFDAGGTGFELLLISAVVLGGVSLAGGQGGLFGALLGLVILGVNAKGMRLMHLSTNYQLIVSGAVMVAAVYMHDIRQRIENLRRK